MDGLCTSWCKHIQAIGYSWSDLRQSFICWRSSSAGFTMSIVNGVRLKGSDWSLQKPVGNRIIRNTPTYKVSCFLSSILSVNLADHIYNKRILTSSIKERSSSYTFVGPRITFYKQNRSGETPEKVWRERINCHSVRGGLSHLSICLAMVDRSTIWPDAGSKTGSDINVPIIGSKYSSGASAMASSSASCWEENACKTRNTRYYNNRGNIYIHYVNLGITDVPVLYFRSSLFQNDLNDFLIKPFCMNLGWDHIFPLLSSPIYCVRKSLKGWTSFRRWGIYSKLRMALLQTDN